MQIWLYECCSTFNTDIATRVANSIPRILSWLASKDKIWLSAIEDRMIKPTWIKFTNIIEAPEELSRMSLPDKVEYILEEVETKFDALKDAASPSGHKQSIGIEDKKDILEQIKKLRKDVDKVGLDLGSFKKDVFEELGSIRLLINNSIKAVLETTNSQKDNIDAKFGGSSTKIASNQKKRTINIFRAVVTSSSKKEENVIQEGDDCCEEGGEPAEYVNLGDSDDSRYEKREVTLDDFELPGNFSQIVKFGELNQDETTPVHQGRTRQPEEHARLPFLPFYSSGGSTSVGPPIFQIKHPFTRIIGEDVDPELLDEFNNWLYLGTDTTSKRRKAPYSVKNNQLKPCHDLGVEKVDKKEWFYILAHPGQVLNDLHNDVILYYLRKRGKYGPHKKIRFTTTDCIFKTRIEQIYQRYINAPPEKKFAIVKPQDIVVEYILGYRLLTNVAWDQVDFVIMPINIVEKFHWLLVVFDIIDRVLYVYDSMVSSPNHTIVESVVTKFALLIPLYLSCTGFYGKRPDINIKNTKAYIEKGVTDPIDIQWLGEIPQQKEGSLDCGVYVVAFAKYASIGDLVVSTDDLSDIDQHRRRYGTLLWDYPRKKQDTGAISESEVTGR
ncbi:PREDICTED: uncharacterized protein LOC109242867 [Nicotiana attenuata]|uniref:uncharacterized protein LOC109242867 n=1 Tax=Nicotiana attenuata TaxID=49451 RepID=UPI000904C300|nr:PREDICTED: uncharacterized protein LOC109242867 [Nicotiana attenuata]